MTLNLSVPGHEDLKPRITVFGVGGAGGNAVNNMIEKQLDGVDFVVANTDAQALSQSDAASRIQLGVKVTEGLGAGAKATIGAAAAEESIEQIVDHLAGAHMCFITAGMGGGTGTGAAPIIAQAARELGVLTVGVVTKPFQFEGGKRMSQAEDGVEALQKVVDTLIIIPNQNLFRLANEKTTFTEAFSMADDVLYQGVKGVTDLMVRPGLINLDFADVRAVMDEMGQGDDGHRRGCRRRSRHPGGRESHRQPASGRNQPQRRQGRSDQHHRRARPDLVRTGRGGQPHPARKWTPTPTSSWAARSTPRWKARSASAWLPRASDAVDVHTDIPVPRRSMAEPLSTTTSLEAHEPEAEEAAPAPSPLRSQQRHLLHLLPHRPNSPPLPGSRPNAPPPKSRWKTSSTPNPPVRTPLMACRRPRLSARTGPGRRAGRSGRSGRTSLDAFVAPKAPTPGTPSPEAMARLQAAVGKAPSAPVERPAAAAPAPVGDAQADRPRFGINSLLNRMTGHAAEPEAPRAPRQQPTIQTGQAQPAAVEPEAERDEQIEIPAFLRRQAN